MRACCLLTDAGFAIVAFPVGIPLLFAVILWSNRKAISSRDASLPCPTELKHIAILFEHYDTSAMYWELAESVRRLLLSSVVGKSSQLHHVDRSRQARLILAFMGLVRVPLTSFHGQ